MGELVNIRDFKRKEEREAADVRLAKQVMGLDGITDALREVGRCTVYDTAPCEMPPVWPSFEAQEQDPA